jgi:hypothetical protein
MFPKHARKQTFQRGQKPVYLVDDSADTAVWGSTVVCDLTTVWGFTADWSSTPVGGSVIRNNDPDTAQQ